jgi:hypothetical protein
VEEETTEEGRSLMMRKVLIKPEKEAKGDSPEEQSVQDYLQDQR